MSTLVSYLFIWITPSKGAEAPQPVNELTLFIVALLPLSVSVDQAVTEDGQSSDEINSHPGAVPHLNRPSARDNSPRPQAGCPLVPRWKSPLLPTMIVRVDFADGKSPSNSCVLQKEFSTNSL
jgi:hypothetical protein